MEFLEFVCIVSSPLQNCIRCEVSRTLRGYFFVTNSFDMITLINPKNAVSGENHFKYSQRAVTVVFCPKEQFFLPLQLVSDEIKLRFLLH